MKTLLIVVALLALASVALAEEAKIYKAGQSVIPQFYAKPRGDGSIGLYNYSKPGGAVIPQYTIKNGQIYAPAQSTIIPVGEIKNGTPKK